MKVLFVSSGNSGSISPIVFNQAQSLLAADPMLEISFFLVKGKGLKGYLSNIPALRKQLKAFKPDLIHAHYSLCGILASFSLTKVPIIASLMGSDIKAAGSLRKMIEYLSRRKWSVTIVKSADLGSALQLRNMHVIPNGVDLRVFQPVEKEKSEMPVILFAANPERKEKNFQLAQSALDLLDFPFELKTLVDIPREKMPEQYAAADLVILSSLWEGSPNVIKESMACGLPVVCTDVGDVKMLFGNAKGLFLSSFDAEDFADKIRQAIRFAETEKRSTGRERIIELKIDSESIARQVLNLYKTSVKHSK